MRLRRAAAECARSTSRTAVPCGVTTRCPTPARTAPACGRPFRSMKKAEWCTRRPATTTTSPAEARTRSTRSIWPPGLWVKQVRAGDNFSFSNLLGGGEDTDFGANPIVADIGGKKLVAAGDKGSAFWALDRESDTGETVWSVPALSAGHAPANGGVLN